MEGESYVIDNDTLMYLDGIMLENVEVTGRQRKTGNNGAFASVSDYSFNESKIEQLGVTSIYELLYRIPSLRTC